MTFTTATTSAVNPQPGQTQTTNPLVKPQPTQTRTTVTTSKYTPQTPPTEVTTPISLGNINGDSSIDSSDATLILSDYAELAVGKESSFTAEQAKAADVNGDGKFDSIDASLILAYYSHIQTGGTGTIEEFIKS